MIEKTRQLFQQALTKKQFKQFGAVRAGGVVLIAVVLNLAGWAIVYPNSPQTEEPAPAPAAAPKPALAPPNFVDPTGTYGLSFPADMWVVTQDTTAPTAPAGITALNNTAWFGLANPPDKNSSVRLGVVAWKSADTRAVIMGAGFPGNDPQVGKLNGNEALYDKVIRDGNTDIKYVITKGDVSVMLWYRQVQAASGTEAQINAQALIPEFQKIVKSFRFL